MTTAADAGTWTLGDLTVNRVGFGAMRLTSGPDGEPSVRDRVIGVLRQAVGLGVNHIDTAAFYFSPLRSANELIGAALAPYPDDLVIATKVGPGRDPSGAWLTATPERLRGQVEENLRQLGRDHLDVVNFRVMGSQETGADGGRDRALVMAQMARAAMASSRRRSSAGYVWTCEWSSPNTSLPASRISRVLPLPTGPGGIVRRLSLSTVQGGISRGRKR